MIDILFNQYNPLYQQENKNESSSQDQTAKLFGILDGGALEVLLCCFAASAAAAAASCSFFAALRAALLLVRGAMLGGRETLLGRALGFGLSAAASGAGEGEAVAFAVPLPLLLVVAALLVLDAAKGRVVVDDGRDTGGGLPG